MHRLQTIRSIPYEDGIMHMVKLPLGLGAITWLAQAQIELDGKRVFVRMAEAVSSAISGQDANMVGLVVSPVY